MPWKIKEADWKLLSQLRINALERLCLRILSEIEHINTNHAISAHQRYAEIYQVIQCRDKEIAQTFDDHRRSTALNELAAIQSHGLLTPEEFQSFSQETRDAISWVGRV